MSATTPAFTMPVTDALGDQRVGRHAADVDDGALPVPTQERQRGLGDPEETDQLRVEDRGQDLLLDLGEGASA